MKQLTRTLTVGLVLLISTMLPGCPETQQMITSVITEEPKDTAPPAVSEEVPTDKSEEPVVVEVIAINYYSDWNFTESIAEEVHVGDTIYTKVVFSGEAPIVIADNERAQPNISYSTGSRKVQYRIKSRGVSVSNLQSGDARIYRNTKDTFICKYTTQPEDANERFLTYIAQESVGSPLHITRTRNIEKERENTDTFIGQVFSPDFENHILKPGTSKPRSDLASPVAGVTVTIMSGTRAGESTVTDTEGYYLFKNSADELHLRTEKDGYEPKEVIVHRSRPTILANGDKPNHSEDPQENPGNILIGHRWPDEVRFILEETLLVQDLLYIVAPLKFQDGSIPGGFYIYGMVVINTSELWNNEVWNKGIIAHELAHAHQHAVTIADGKGLIEWENTPEGRSFARALNKDWEQVGKSPCDTIPGLNTPFENAAETAAAYWGSTGKWYRRPECENMKIDAPNRFKWAKEWLSR